MSMSYALEMTAELNEHITSVQGFMSLPSHIFTQAYKPCRQAVIVQRTHSTDAITITIAIATDIEYICMAIACHMHTVLRLRMWNSENGEQRSKRQCTHDYFDLTTICGNSNYTKFVSVCVSVCIILEQDYCS